MTKRKRNNGKWAYTSYRYGQAKRGPLPRIFAGEKRQHVIAAVIEAMRDWRSSPFEHEGVVRSSLRSALCLAGHDWYASDAEAASLIEAALQILGAVRPTWEQGQRDYVIPRENCRWCACPLQEEEYGGLRKGFFCSPECARSAILYRDLKTTNSADKVAMAAHSIIERTTRPLIECQQCGKQFHSYTKVKSQKYCSHNCAQLAHRTIIARPCTTCGKLFRPTQMDKSGKYCSTECFKTRTLHERECVLCGTAFQPNSEIAIFCSQTCNKYSFKIRSGHVKRISSRVFDYVFSAVA